MEVVRFFGAGGSGGGAGLLDDESLATPDKIFG